MNILLIHQNFPGQFKFLAPALVDRGHKLSIVCITLDKTWSDDRIQVHQYKVNRSSTTNIHPWIVDLETKIIRGEACYDACKQLRASGYYPDIVIAHSGWGESLFTKEVWPKCKLAIYSEYYYQADGADVGFDPEFSLQDKARCAMRAKNLNNIAHFDIADAAISPTEWQKDTFPEPFRSKIKVIHDGIDTGICKPNANASLRISIGDKKPLLLTKNDEILTFVNRNLEPYRGYHSFMRSLPAILKERPNLKVLIAGGDGVSYGAPPDQARFGRRSWKEIYANEIRAQLSDTQWKQVVFLGKMPYEHYLSLLQISTVHVYLTYPFILSWSLLEAMSMACAIVGSKTKPVEEVIQNEKNGLLVNFFDANELASGTIRLLENPMLREELGKSARDTVLRNYDLQNVCLPEQVRWIESL